jgi:hypothetical protein
MRLLTFCFCLVISALITLAISIRAVDAQAGDQFASGDGTPTPNNVEARDYLDDPRIPKPVPPPPYNNPEYMLLVERGVADAPGSSSTTAANIVNVAVGPLSYITGFVCLLLFGSIPYYMGIKKIAFRSVKNGGCCVHWRSSINQARFNILLANGLSLSVYAAVLASVVPH